MRRGPIATILVLAAVLGVQTPALGSIDIAIRRPAPLRGSTRAGPTPLGWYGLGSIACAAVSPMIGTLMLSRELTIPEVDRMALSCFLGPVGWLLGPVLFPDAGRHHDPPAAAKSAAARPRHTRGRHIDIPPRGVTAFVPNEILLEVESGTPAQYLNVVARRLQLTLLGDAELHAHRPHLAALAHRRRQLGAHDVAAGSRPLAGFRRRSRISSTGSARRSRRRSPTRGRAICRAQAAFAGSAQDHQWRRRAGGGDRFQDRR